MRRLIERLLRESTPLGYISEGLNSTVRNLSDQDRNEIISKVSKAFDETFKECLPRIVEEKLFDNNMFHELRHRLAKLEHQVYDPLRRVTETSSGSLQDAKQVENTTIPTQEMGTTDTSNLAFLLGKVWAELDFLINTVTNTRENLLKHYNDAVDGDPGPVAADNSDSDNNVGKSERGLSEEFFVAKRRDVEIWLMGNRKNDSLFWLEWTGDK